MTGEKISQKPEDRIQNYLDRFREITEMEDSRERSQGVEAIKKIMYKDYIIEKEDIPQRVFELEQNIAENNGYWSTSYYGGLYGRKIMSNCTKQIHPFQMFLLYLIYDLKEFKKKYGSNKTIM